MKRNQFIKSLGIMVGAGVLLPEAKPEKVVLPAATSNADMLLSINGVERMRITSSGNVSLGCTNPSAKLIVYGGTPI